MINIEDKLNEATMKCNSLTAIVEEKTEMLDKYMQKNKEQFEEILGLKSLEEEFSRKNKTLTILINSIEDESKQKMDEIYAEIKSIKVDHYRDIERKSLEFEDLWELARINLQLYQDKAKELKVVSDKYEEISQELSLAYKTIQKKNECICGKLMIIEEFQMELVKQAGSMLSKIQEFENLRIKHYELNREHQDYLNKIPSYLRQEKNPFIVLEDRIQDLEDQISKIISSKENMIDEETQFLYQKDEKDQILQTDLNSQEFEKLLSRNSVEKIDQCIQSSMPEIIPHQSISSGSNNKDFPLRKKLGPDDLKPESSQKSRRQQSLDSIQREEEVTTPVNLKSIYKHEDEAEEAKNTKLPSIAKKIQNLRPPTMPLPLTSDIKRHIKQANSRRKNDVLFS